MDSGKIGQHCIGSVNYQKPPQGVENQTKPSQDFVTEWQMPEIIDTGIEPSKAKLTDWPNAGPSGANKAPEASGLAAVMRQADPDLKPEITVKIIDTGIKGPETRVPTTLSMDDPAALEDFIGWGISRNEGVPKRMDDPDQLADFIKWGIDHSEQWVADPSTAFYKIGMNTINSIARDGIFTVDGEQLAKPGAQG